ncbi:neurotrophin-7 [Gadus chalcogrammus]|uniref:neurotrophin-7 n=1 Tax=Gadus chalcogrammus TaxID=1042646 RepID=UPI0024C471CA|nr:neurotrophin-7 [Gadus chalcogrammus]
MRSPPLVLLLLMGVQAVLNMGGGRALSTEAANHDAGQQTAADHRAGQQQQQTAAGDHLPEHRATSPPEHRRNGHHRTRRPHRPPATQTPGAVSVPQSISPLDLSIPEVDPKIFSKRRFRSSPRVVFSETPPSHDVPEGKDSDVSGGAGGGGRGSRVRRRAGTQLMHRGEYSVCDSVSDWVGNRTTATDIWGNEVTVLPNVRIENLVKKQFFYETTCLSPTQRGPGGSGAAGGGGGGGAAGAGGNRGGGRAGARSRKQSSRAADSGCRGIDVRYWNSYCTNTHTYVSAMTTFEEKAAWRNIRINVACVCVLTRKSWQGRAGR